MRIKTWISVILTAALMLSVSACKWKAPNPNAYETYTSEVNGFSVVLPEGYMVEEDAMLEEGKMGIARFTVDRSEVGIVIDVRKEAEEPFPVSKKEYREKNPGEEVIRFTDLSKPGEFDGYKVMIKTGDTEKVGVLYAFRFGEAEVTMAAKAENRRQAEFLEVGLDQIRLPQKGGGIL